MHHRMYTCGACLLAPLYVCPDSCVLTCFTMLQWRDPKGKLRKWESAERSTRAACGVDGVAIIAHVTGGDGPPRVILESQFRPPQGNVCIEVHTQQPLPVRGCQ